MYSFINKDALEIGPATFTKNVPYPHIVIENFFRADIAEELSRGFPDYDGESWNTYDNPLENKKTLNAWDSFNRLQYQVFMELNSPEFVHFLEGLTGARLCADIGLHGGGLHIHANGGKLNPHLDYSIHPKTGMQRKLNLLVYLEKDFKKEYGGWLGMWLPGTADAPGDLAREIVPYCNRAVIFDTTDAWHGMSRGLTMPEGTYRKSIAVYYVQTPAADASPRPRALYAPVGRQIGDEKIAELIKLRSSNDTCDKVYISTAASGKKR